MKLVHLHKPYTYTTASTQMRLTMVDRLEMDPTKWPPIWTISIAWLSIVVASCAVGIVVELIIVVRMVSSYSCLASPLEETNRKLKATCSALNVECCKFVSESNRDTMRQNKRLEDALANVISGERKPACRHLAGWLSKPKLCRSKLEPLEVSLFRQLSKQPEGYHRMQQDVNFSCRKLVACKEVMPLLCLTLLQG